MKRAFVLCILVLGLPATAAATADRKGCADHPLLPTRMPDYYISDCQVRDFDAYGFFEPKGKKRNEEGKFTFITYTIERGRTEQSGVAIVRNYENAITKIGGKIANIEPQRWVNASVVIDGREAWVQAEKGNGKIWLRIIEKAPMAQHIAADAAFFAKDLKSTGHVAVYGIHFDSGKSVVKPESKPALDEVAKLLKSDPGLKLWVVGHTDSVGRVDDNLRLAQARAEAVAAELASAHGVAASRLKGFGAGPLAPVAENDSEAGRAKNRRVELVRAPS